MRAIVILLSVLLVSSCVSSSRNPRISSEAAMIEAYIEKGKKMEGQGRFPQALEQYEKALSLDPDNKSAILLKKQVLFLVEKKDLTNLVKGETLDEQGKKQSLKKEHSNGLKDWPVKSIDKLDFTGQGAKKEDYIIHTLDQGENISKLGLIYYGDLKAYPVIGEFNRLNDMTRVRAGQKLKIPAIEGIPLTSLQQAKKKYIKSRENKEKPKPSKKNSKHKIKSVKLQRAVKKDQGQPAKKNISLIKQGGESRDKKMIQPSRDRKEGLFANEKLYALYDKGVKLYNNKEYKLAISMFLEAEKGDPHNEFLRNYLFESYFQLGLILYKLEQYSAAKNHFESAFSYNIFCEKCADYIDKCKSE